MESAGEKASRLEHELNLCKCELQYYKGFHDGVKEFIRRYKRNK